MDSLDTDASAYLIPVVHRKQGLDHVDGDLDVVADMTLTLEILRTSESGCSAFVKLYPYRKPLFCSH